MFTISFFFLVHLLLDFYMTSVFKYKGIAVIASLIYWIGQLFKTLGELLSQPGIWVDVFHGHPYLIP